MSTPIYPLEFKPDLEDTAHRWEAFYTGEIVDRPIVCVTARKDPDYKRRGWSYHDTVFGNLEEIVDGSLENASHIYYGGESVPAFYPSFGPDSAAVFCGGNEFHWSDGSPDTNWSKPFVERWEDVLPLKLQEDHPLWKRQLEFYRIAAAKMEGKMLLRGLDWHTNLDLLSAARGPQRLCMDMAECPEIIDAAMESARPIFRRMWDLITDTAKMYERGFSNAIYSMDGADILQCDFGAMISPAMFKRWALPALEEEASIVKHVYYHWDGPTQLAHTDLLCTSKGITLLDFVMGAGNGKHIDWLDLYKSLQKRGRSVVFVGDQDEVKTAHKELDPRRVVYFTGAKSPKEADDLLAWFVANT